MVWSSSGSTSTSIARGEGLVTGVEQSSIGHVVSVMVLVSGVSKPSSAVQAQVKGSVGVRNDSSSSPAMLRLWGERMVTMACWMVTNLAVAASAVGTSSSSSSILASMVLRVVSLPLSMSAWQATLVQYTLLPGLVIPQVLQLQGRISQFSGWSARWCSMARERVLSSHSWDAVSGVPPQNWCPSPWRQE